MKKKIILATVCLLLIMPIGYASFLAFYTPRIVYEHSYYENTTEEYLRRYNYKPWSGGRPDTDMNAYNQETKSKFDSTKAAFDKTQKQYDAATKAVEQAAKEFDRIILTNY